MHRLLAFVRCCACSLSGHLSRSANVSVLQVALLVVVCFAGPTQAADPVVTQVATNYASDHSCALMTNGAVKCWGDNVNGQLGDGTKTNRSTPTDVSGFSSGVVAVALGENHTCALTTGGGVKCWGLNSSGQLGNGTTTTPVVAVNVSGLTGGVAAITAGQSHSCALMASGGVKCWGSNHFAQLGDGTKDDRLTPTDVSGLTGGVVAIAAGSIQTCALTTGGGVKCWGDNIGGLPGGTPQLLTPTDVTGLTSGVVAISSGHAHTCALTSAGGVKCFGNSGDGRLGDGTTAPHSTPTDVSGLTSGVAAVSAALGHTCAVTTAGVAKCWGRNSSGQLGDGTTNQRLTPTDVSGLSGGVASISGAGTHTCALTINGGAKCWGNNVVNQLGDGTTTQSLVSTDVSGLALSGQTVGQSVNFALPVASISVGRSANPSATATSALLANVDTYTTSTCTVTNGALVTGVAPGLCMLRAGQAGNTTHKAAPFQTRLLLIDNIPTTNNVVITATPNPPGAGSPLVLLVTVTGTSPSGTVTINDGSRVLGTMSLSNGTGLFTTSNLAAGPHTLIATYSGDSVNPVGNSVPIDVTIPAGVTLNPVSVAFSPNPPVVGLPVTLTASVDGNNPSGEVIFLDGTTEIGRGSVTGGRAFTIPIFSVGKHNITARYSGDAANPAATSPVASFDVQSSNGGGGGSGGGCSINPNAAFDPTLLLVWVLALGYSVRQRTKLTS